MTRGHIVHEMPNFTSGGVNLVHFIKKRPEITQHRARSAARRLASTKSSKGADDRRATDGPHHARHG